MTTSIQTISKEKLISFLKKIDVYFSPPLTSKVNIEVYTEKLLNNAYIDYNTYDDDIIALFAGYINESTFFLTLFVIDEIFQGKKVSYPLFKKNIDYLRKEKISIINLEVYKNNHRAITFYKKFNFEIISENNDSYFMSASIC
ncbi:GNAT family N-acetyltransferase [Morganella morganii]|nr:GNAT family N-acetyltransferase [Morganella morganii]EKW3940657.1 GNAT family N-acetyltransferase [Morganella morganii]